VDACQSIDSQEGSLSLRGVSTTSSVPVAERRDYALITELGGRSTYLRYAYYKCTYLTYVIYLSITLYFSSAQVQLTYS
jgi:hypothetical protein